MNESSSRMTQPGKPPSDSEVAEWIGNKAYKYWKQVTQFIERSYPDVFAPEWLFGGKKHGWGLRYKKSKSFCTFIPEKDCFSLIIVFGAEEREKAEAIKEGLSARTRKDYDNAATYHDGKWVRLAVDSDTIVEDVRQLLALKRRPSVGKGAR